MTLLRQLVIWSTIGAAACAPGGDGPQLVIAGHVSAASARAISSAARDRVITDVMAVDPQSASPRRTLAHVGADGSFELAVDLGRPYVFVLVDRTAVGADMAVAVFRANTLDTLSPQLAGHLDVGDVTIDPAAHTASLGISYDELLAGLGLSPAAAEYLGSIDDLSLRYANPDIDGDGVIDLEQDHRYALDFHVRASMRHGSATGRSVIVDDLTDRFLATSGPDVATPVFDLTSVYVLYPATLDATAYVAQGMPASAPQNGGAFAATLGSGVAPAAPSSFSSLSFGDTSGWGPDYSYQSAPDLELPGSGGSPATLAYTLGAIGETLTFTNVVTRARASLTNAGTLAIFIRLVTADHRYTGLDYTWMKRASPTSWVPATAEEIAVTISGDGGHVSFHHTPSWHNEFGAVIPPQPSGSIAWAWADTGPDDVCGLAVSYDDKLGLRHFLGGADPDPGVTCTP